VSQLTPYALQKSSVLRWLQKHDDDDDEEKASTGHSFTDEQTGLVPTYRIT